MSELPRYMNCPICKHYHTTYPYCDMCKDGNRFEYAVEIITKKDEKEYATLSLATPCLICGGPVTMNDLRDYPKICEKCKEAVKYARTLMESDTDRFIENYMKE